MIRDWTSSEKVNKLTAHGERFFTRLIMKVDDFGNYPESIKLLNGNLFPDQESIKETDIKKWLGECLKVGVIERYTVGNKTYLHIPNFGQRLDKSKAKYPQPGEGVTEVSGNVPGKNPAELELEEEPEKELEPETARAILPDIFFGEEVQAAWEEWKKYRSEIKKKLSPSTEKKQMQFLGGRAGPEAIAIINQSIEKGWTGLFNLKKNDNGTNFGASNTTGEVFGEKNYKQAKL